VRFNFDYPQSNEKVAMIIYCRHGKFRITEREEKLLFASPPEGDLVQKLLTIRKEKKSENLLA